MSFDPISRRLATLAGTNAANALSMATASQISANSAQAALTNTLASAQTASFAAGFNCVRTLGYASPGDGGEGLYRRVASQPTHPGCFRSTDQLLPDGTLDATNGGWWELVPERGEINLLQFGADKTGASPSDAAFVAAHQMRAAYRNTLANITPFEGLGLLVPAGRYVLAQSESLCPASYASYTTGFRVRGAGQDITTIVFAPTSGSKVALYNQAFLIASVEDLSFVGTGLDQTFYRADMTNNFQQAWSFRRCAWQGVWGRGFHLTGTNNNSEYNWYDCRGDGQMFQFLYTPPAGNGGSDQFLNYRFNACEFWFTNAVGGTSGTLTGAIAGGVLTVSALGTGTVLAAGQTIATPTASANAFGNVIAGQTSRVVVVAQLSGTAGGVGSYSVAFSAGTVASGTLAALTNDGNSLIDMATGGQVHLWACDFSGWLSGTTFQLRGGSHALGVCNLTALSCRQELKSENTAVLYSEWPQGLIQFQGCDWSSQTLSYFRAKDGAVPNCFYIASANTAGARVVWRDCQIIGAVAIAHGTEDYARAKSLVMDGCQHSQLADVYAAFRWVASVNDSGAAAVQITNMRNSTDAISSHAAWAAATAYTVGQVVASNGGRSLYKCTQAGTSGSAGATFTGAINGTTLTVSSVASGTLSVGLKLVGSFGAAVVGNTTSGSTTLTVTARSNGQIGLGQTVSGAGVPSGTTVVAFGTYDGTSGTVVLSAAATATATGTAFGLAGRTMAEDTVITAGSGTSWTVNRSQTAVTQSTSAVGGPQSAGGAIADGAAVWAYVANSAADYANDGAAVSVNFAGVPVRMPSQRRVAEFGGQIPTNTGGSYGTVELILPPGAMIVGAHALAPAGSVTSLNPADYLLECDDGTVLLQAYAASAAGGFAARNTALAVAVGNDMQRRRIKLVAGAVAGSTVDQYNSKARVWVEYLL